MKKLTVLLILFATQWALAIPYEPTPIVMEDFFQYIKKQKEGDKERITINFGKLEALINKLERHAMSYPVKFDNQEDYLQAQKEAATMTNILDVLYPFAA